jgi:hypothetical protein
VEEVEKDLWEMEFKRWRQTAVDRKEWVHVIRVAKGVTGP